MNFKIKMFIKNLLSIPTCALLGIKEHGKCCYIGPRTNIYFKNAKLKLGNRTNISADNTIYCFPNSEITIGDNTDIGRFSRITSRNLVRIGKNIITGPNVFISDYNHQYKKIGIPIKHQGYVCNGNKVIIEDDSWIGTNTVIVGNVRIGKGSVIGANSVVNKDIPDYCVAVGAPAKVIKKFNETTKEWEKVSSTMNGTGITEYNKVVTN